MLNLITKSRLVLQRFASSTSANPNREVGLIHIDDHFRSIPKENRNKQTFLEAIELFKRRARNERGHVEFINSAMKQMKEFGLHKDLDIYKALLDVFPKGSLVSRNQWQKMFMHFPHQQSCCMRLLDEMEWNMVYPDREVHDKVIEIFGDWTQAAKKSRRMFYWLPRLRYTNKYLDKKLQRDRHADLDFAESARLALEMMSRDKGTEITYSTVANDQNLIVSAQSPLQRRLIRRMPMDSTCFYIDGPFYVYLVAKRIPYITLTTPPIRDHEQLADKFIDHAELEDINSVRLYDGIMPEDDDPTIHEQTTETILGLAAIEKLSEASASAWITHLQFLCAPLKTATVILRINV
ncbi:Evolutionarily conserved signaling intermediate in Toll pathway, mitochondrial [Aphelenchoides besseyi]|nr:Evolutionarily conserved signaling intermediate in Toll pathway, mitochondrial [Aphelenchoides besseyi]KAI6211654.1 Evolutionarily conserved signaling intermediate in Toll pathway, mitochondrial [Aphelenchoides besseyi]